MCQRCIQAGSSVALGKNKAITVFPLGICGIHIQFFEIKVGEHIRRRQAAAGVSALCIVGGFHNAHPDLAGHEGKLFLFILSHNIIVLLRVAIVTGYHILISIHGRQKLCQPPSGIFERIEKRMGKFSSFLCAKRHRVSSVPQISIILLSSIQRKPQGRARSVRSAPSQQGKGPCCGRQRQPDHHDAGHSIPYSPRRP